MDKPTRVPHEYMQTIPSYNELDMLRAAKSRYDLARLLNIEVQFLTRVLYEKPYRNRYRTFEIPKKNGGKRVITAPDKKLAEIQSRLAKVLYNCRAEIAKTEASTVASSYGFEKNRSALHNARKHIGRRYVFNFDLKDFFPSIHIGRVKGFLIKDRNFELNEDIALLISQIACHEGRLPQGSPLSPIISNMVAQVLDRRLRKFGNIERCSYSRYADDITFSTNMKDFSDRIAEFQDKKWKVAQPLEKLINKSGYKINHSKTRMQQSHQRQIVTGLTVNSKPLPNIDYRKQTRAMCHSLFNKGKYSIDSNEFDISVSPKNIRPIKGRISYVAHTAQQSKEDDTVELSVERLQRRFVYFESFVLREQAIIIPEGITDRLYLKMAFRHKELIPKHLLKDGEKLKLEVFNPTRSKRDYLKIGDGAQQIKNFMFKYVELKETYKFYPGNSAIIGLLDSDKEGLTVLRILEKKFNAERLSESSWFLGDNLYIVCLNHNGESQEIENYFPYKLLEKTIEKRKFELISKTGDTYSKKEFAKFIVPKYATKSDFEEFKKIFASFEECVLHNIEYHKANSK